MAEIGSSPTRGDLILNPGEFAFVQDRSKGNVSVNVGPLKASMSDTESTVVWDDGARRFKATSLDTAVQPFISVPEGSYVVVTNPAKDANKLHPLAGITNAAELNHGRRIHMNGPTVFPLWPGQTAAVIEGHRLRSNQYLLVRVYNDEVAAQNWEESVIKPSAEGSDSGEEGKPDEVSTIVKPDKFTMGQLFVIRGTDVSFYIPPTGIEVVPDDEGDFVRDAVTLERLEYCILLDESGDKRFVEGPVVVFPEPTETFVYGKEGDEQRTRKFRAIDLNEIQGIYVKVIEDYVDDNDESHKAGDELFITGKQQAIYYPRREHSIIRYGKDTKHYAIAIPAGEARYVLDRMGDDGVRLVKGPKMFLPDPRKEVLVRRVLTPREAKLWFPGNDQVREFNDVLRATVESQGTGFVTGRQASELVGTRAYEALGARHMAEGAESFQRGSSFSKPRTITLDNKFDGSVRIEAWPGYAILVVSKTGSRRVVVGPETTHLEYDEALLPLTLSTGRPKTDDRTIETVYLKVRNNTVSDVVFAETRDLCGVEVEVSYRVNFTDEDGRGSEKWFDVDNYVKFLTDHLRSLLRHAIKQLGIGQFYQNATSVVRDTILGISEEEDDEEGRPGRPGRRFEENLMHVYDVEVLDVKITNRDIANLLVMDQEASVRTALEAESLMRAHDFATLKEEIKRKDADEANETSSHLHKQKVEDLGRQLELNLQAIKNKARAQNEETTAELERQADLGEISAAGLAREKTRLDQAFEEFQRRLEASTKAVTDQFAAVDPKLADAMVLMAHVGIGERVSKDMAPLIALGGGDVETMWNSLVQGTFLEGMLERTRRPSDRQIASGVSAD